MQGTIWEINVGVFLLITVFLAGGAGYMSGRSAALGWRPWPYLAAYSAALACAARFLNYALFQGTFVSVHYWLVDFIIILAISGVGYRLTRTSQMVNQYSWLYERAGPFSWRPRPRPEMDNTGKVAPDGAAG